MGMAQDAGSRNSPGSFSCPYSSRVYRSAYFCGYHSDLHIYGAPVCVFGNRDGGGALTVFPEFFWAKSVVPFQCEPGGTVSGNHLLAAIHKEEVMKKWTMVLVALAAVVLFASPAVFPNTGTCAARRQRLLA